MIFSQLLHGDFIHSKFSCALWVSPISCIFRIWVFWRTFSFIDSSSCSRSCSRPDWTNPYCASCNANLCCSVCRCSSPMHLLRDSTWSSCFARSDLAWSSKWSLLPSRRDPLKFDELAFPNTELLIWFSLFRWKQCIGFPRSFLPFRWIRPQTIFFDRIECIVHWPLSLLHDHCIRFLRNFLGIQWWSPHLFKLCIFEIRVCSAFHGIVEVHVRLDVGLLWYFRIRHTSRPNFSKVRHFFGDRSSVIMLSKIFLYIILLIWISRISFDPWDSRKFVGLMTCGSCCVRVSAVLQVFTAEWFLMAPLVGWVSLEMCGMYWEFSLCGRIGRWRRGSAQGGRRVREQPWMTHLTRQMTKRILGHKDACQSRLVLNLSQAHWVCSARCDQTVLHRCVLWVGVLSTWSVQSCTMAQAESWRYKLLGGIAVRRPCHSVVRFSMGYGTSGSWLQRAQETRHKCRTSTLSTADMNKLISLTVPRKTLEGITLETDARCQRRTQRITSWRSWWNNISPDSRFQLGWTNTVRGMQSPSGYAWGWALMQTLQVRTMFAAAGDGRNRGRGQQGRVGQKTKHLSPMKAKTEETPSWRRTSRRRQFSQRTFGDDVAKMKPEPPDLERPPQAERQLYHSGVREGGSARRRRAKEHTTIHWWSDRVAERRRQSRTVQGNVAKPSSESAAEQRERDRSPLAGSHGSPHVNLISKAIQWQERRCHERTSRWSRGEVARLMMTTLETYCLNSANKTQRSRASPRRMVSRDTRVQSQISPSNWTPNELDAIVDKATKTGQDHRDEWTRATNAKIEGCYHPSRPTIRHGVMVRPTVCVGGQAHSTTSQTLFPWPDNMSTRQHNTTWQHNLVFALFFSIVLHVLSFCMLLVVHLWFCVFCFLVFAICWVHVVFFCVWCCMFALVSLFLHFCCLFVLHLFLQVFVMFFFACFVFCMFVFAFFCFLSCFCILFCMCVCVFACCFLWHVFGFACVCHEFCNLFLASLFWACCFCFFFSLSLPLFFLLYFCLFWEDKHIPPPHRRCSGDQTTRPLDNTTPLDNPSTNPHGRCIILDVASHGWVRAGYSRYSRAHHDGEAVGGSTTHSTGAHSDAFHNMGAEPSSDTTTNNNAWRATTGEPIRRVHDAHDATTLGVAWARFTTNAMSIQIDMPVGATSTVARQAGKWITCNLTHDEDGSNFAIVDVPVARIRGFLLTDAPEVTARVSHWVLSEPQSFARGCRGWIVRPGLYVRGALLARGPDSSLGEVHRGSCSGNIHMEEETEVKVQKNDVEDGRDKWRVRSEGRREVKHTGAWHMDEMTRTNTWALSQCRVTDYYTCAQTREKNDVWGVLFTRSPSAVNETNCNKKDEVTSKKISWASTNFWTCPTKKRLRKSPISCTAVEILVLQFPHLIHDEDGFWERLQLENLVEVA